MSSHIIDTQLTIEQSSTNPSGSTCIYGSTNKVLGGEFRFGRSVFILAWSMHVSNGSLKFALPNSFAWAMVSNKALVWTLCAGTTTYRYRFAENQSNHSRRPRVLLTTQLGFVRSVRGPKPALYCHPPRLTSPGPTILLSCTSSFWFWVQVKTHSLRNMTRIEAQGSPSSSFR